MDDSRRQETEEGVAATHTLRDAQPMRVAPTTGTAFNVLSFDLVPVACLQLRDMLFEFDSSFPQPTLAVLLAELTPLREMRKSSKGELPPLSVFGHADPAGDDAYNKQLSGRRAKAIYAVLTHDLKMWDSLFDTPFGGDNWNGKNVTAAMRKALGDKGSKTRAQLSQAYMAMLFPAPLSKSDFLGKGASSAGKADFQGCGEFNPLMLLSKSERDTLPAAKRNQENARNRRVVIFMFRAGTKITPSKWPCPTVAEGTGACTGRFFGPPKTGEKRRSSEAERRSFETSRDTFACRFYDRMARLSPCEAPPPPVVKAYALTNVKTPTHIASGSEKIKIEYDIVNKGQAITSGKVEILRKKDNKVLKTFALTPAQFAEGHHVEFEWDGAVDKGDEFPDGFATIEHSDYAAKVTVTGDQGDKHGTADVKVELKDFKIELGKKEYLKDDDFGKRSREVLAQIPALPSGTLTKLMLPSNLFAKVGGEMEDQTAYTEYQSLWSGGPRLPICATATVIDSKGNEVRAGKALGRARVVWDYVDLAQSITTYRAVEFKPPALDDSTGHATDSQGAKPYVDKAREHKKSSVPKNGDNAHTDFDGKRTDNPGPPIFHGGDGGTVSFPFVCNPGGTRKWAGMSPFERSGDEEARAGAIFRPSRMAGDNYSLTAYLDIRRTLDVADEKPPSPDREIAIGQFEVWRRINLVEHYRKNSAVTGTMATFAEYFEDGYVEVKDDRGGTIQDLTKAWYDTEMTAAIAAVTGYALLKKYALRPVSHWDDGGAAATGWIASFKAYNAFKADVQAGEKLSAAQLTTVLTNAGVETHKKYVRRTAYYAADMGELLCKKKVAKEGLTILQFDACSSLELTTWQFLNGMAVFTERKKTGFLLTNTKAGTEQTPAHEIGHCMFLPHAPRVDVDSPGVRTEVTSGGGITPDFHDGKNWNCLMSYNRPRPGFCGLCLLRLRGYKGDSFDKNGPK